MLGCEALSGSGHVHLRSVRLRDLSRGWAENELYALCLLPFQILRREQSEREALHANEGIEIHQIPRAQTARAARSGQGGGLKIMLQTIAH